MTPCDAERAPGLLGRLERKVCAGAPVRSVKRTRRVPAGNLLRSCSGPCTRCAARGTRRSQLRWIARPVRGKTRTTAAAGACGEPLKRRNQTRNGMSRGRTNHRLARGAQVTALFVAYLVTARLGLKVDAVSGFATLVWPPTGIALFALVAVGYRLWPAVFAGALIANLFTGAPLLVAMGIAAGNTAEVLLATLPAPPRRVRPRPRAGPRRRGAGGRQRRQHAAERHRRRREPLGGRKSSRPPPSAHVEGLVAGRRAGGPHRRAAASSSGGDASSCARPARVAEAALVGRACWGSRSPCSATWCQGAPVPVRLAVLHLPRALLGGAALHAAGRGEPTLLLAGVAITSTALGFGPFARPVLSESLLLVQVFMAVSAITALLLAAASRSETARARPPRSA